MSKYEIDAYPTMLFLENDGQLIFKRVGVISASTIQKVANDAMNPEQAEINIMRKDYKNGERSKECLGKFLRVLLEEGLENEAQEVAAEYLDVHPSLDLQDKNDWTAFRLCVIDLDDARIDPLFTEAEKLFELHEDEFRSKILELILRHAELAMANNDKNLVDKLVEQCYDAYELSFDDDALSKDELMSAILSDFPQDVTIEFEDEN